MDSTRLLYLIVMMGELSRKKNQLIYSAGLDKAIIKRHWYGVTVDITENLGWIKHKRLYFRNFAHLDQVIFL